MKVHIASSRGEEIGALCQQHAEQTIPDGFTLVDDPDDCDIFISILYDSIVKQEFIDGCTRCINFHPGVLPDYRGAGAYSWALINKEESTGVTVHEIDCNIDSGSIIEVRKTLIYPEDTAESLFKRCMKLLYSAFCDHFYDILYGSYSTYPNNGGRLYLRKHLNDAKDITHLVRAFTFSGKESCYYYDNNGNKQYVTLEI